MKQFFAKLKDALPEKRKTRIVLGVLVEDFFFNWLEKVTIRRWGMSAANERE